jgi:hypothetical protein
MESHKEHDGSMTGPVLSQVVVAAVRADGRTCAAQAVPGGGLGHPVGPAVVAACPVEVRAALDWLPGRILVLMAAALDPAELTAVVRSAHLGTIRGVVVLAQEALALYALRGIDGRVPVVRVERDSDQRCIRRATLLGIDVRAKAPPALGQKRRRTIDLRPRSRPVHGYLPGVVARSGEPGIVAH